MAELTPTDVETYTQGRLHRDDSETARMLTAALAAARRYCGWHVSPVKAGEVLTLDGPRGRVLDLPTRKLLDLTSITEDGRDLDVDGALNWSENGSVRKRSGGRWSGCYRSIVATITHGYTEEEAADWRQAVLSSIDQVSQTIGGGLPRVIGPFQFETDPYALERSTFDLFAREWSL